MSIWFVKKLVKILISFRRSYLLRSINLINPFTPSLIRKLFTNYCNPPPSKKKKKENNKNERRIKLENHRSSSVAIQANPSLFDEKSTIDNPRAKLWPRLFIIAQPSFVAGATPRPRSPSVPSWKSGRSSSSREGRSWGDKRFVLLRPRSKWLFRGQESPRELKIRAIGHEGEGLAG